MPSHWHRRWPETKKEMNELLQKAPVPKARNHSRHRFTSIRAARIFAAAQAVLGAACMLFTQQIHALLPYILGSVMALSGICDIYRGIVTGEFRRSDTKLTSHGISILLLGWVILYSREHADSIIGAIWGIIGLTKGTETLNRAICKGSAKEPFAGELIHGSIELVLGILLLADPLTAVGHHLFLLGIELIAVGIQAVKEAKKSPAAGEETASLENQAGQAD